MEGGEVKEEGKKEGWIWYEENLGENGAKADKQQRKNNSII
jgi:hypothetical protein